MYSKVRPAARFDRPVLGLTKRCLTRDLPRILDAEPARAEREDEPAVARLSRSRADAPWAAS
jgi:hypothetical protein